MNKIKFNRFERYIPEPTTEGILRVSDNEKELIYTNINDLSLEFSRDDLIVGCDISYDEISNTFTIGTGQIVFKMKNSEDSYFKYFDKQTIDTLDLSLYAISANETYYVIATLNNDIVTYSVENKATTYGENNYRKLLFKFITSEKENKVTVKSYFPKKDLFSEYKNRFIIAESLGNIGYKVYSDGWKVQWGTNANPTFPIAFDEIPVIVERGATNVTRTGMTISEGYWQVKGY